MGKTLAKVVTPTEAHCDNAAEQHLGPCDDGHEFANPGVDYDYCSPAVSTALATKYAADESFLLFKM